MKKILFLILSSFIVLGACGNNDSEKKEDNKTSEHKNLMFQRKIRNQMIRKIILKTIKIRIKNR